jgi:preprotein translocase subunit SecA
MPGRRWSDGLHQAVEAKEAPRGARIKEENQTLATITFQNFFRLYDKISGMTGTALTEAGEFQKIYKLDVVPIPTNRPLRRTEYHDLIYGTAKEKWTAIVDEIVSVHQTGRPILVGTISIEASEKLSRLLERRGIEHEVLNAKHHEREALIVKDAGQFGAVTVATNMAGRGTDIMLGRCTWQQVLAHLKESGLTPRDISPNVGREEAQSQLERYWYEYWDLGKDNGSPSDEEVLRRLEAHWRDRGMHPIVLGENVAELGGLHIVATERHEARRIDNQLRGRAGRQGDPGSSRFFVSLEDDLMKIFMAQWVRNFMVRAGLSEGQPIESGMVSRAIERAQRKVEEQNFEVRKNLLEYDEVMDEQRKLIYDQRQEVLEGGERLEPVEIIQRGVDRYIQREAADLPARVFDLLRQTAAAAGVDVSRDEWEGADRDGLETILRKKAEQAFRVGVGREAVDAWVGQLLADGRADGGEYPEHWQLGRLARWAQNLGLDVSEAQLSDIVRERLADVVADAAKARRRGDVDDLLRDWFVVGYEQDLALLSRSGRWELDTFRHWLSTVGVSIEIVEWTPARTTCEALTPLWLEAARKAFAGRSPADVAGELARAAAALYLGSSALRHRPDARRIAYWAERRLAVEVTPYALLDAYDSVVAPALVRAVADPVEKRLASLSTSAAADAWATATAAWHLDAHLRFQAHHVVGLATYLSARLRVGLNSLELARHPVDAIPGYVLEQLETHGSTQVDGESFEGLEDIAFNMVDGALARLVENSLADRIGSTPTERSFAPLATWANELSLSLAEEQWRAFDLHELRLHFLREAADAYPAETSGELVEDFIPRFARSPVQRFLNSDGFREQPSYASLAGWAVERYGYLPRDSQVEAQVKRFAEDSLKETCARLVEAKLEDFGQERIEIDNAVEDLVPPTLDALRSLSEGDEVDLGGLAAFARKVFDVSIPVHRLEEEAQGDEREAVRVLTNQAKGRYARRGLDGLVGDAVAGIFELCMPSEQFPTEWRCEVMHDWLRATGLSAVLSAEDLREDTLGAIRSYFERAALDALRERPAEQTRDVLVTAALQVFLESSLAEEGNDFMGLANALHGKFGLDVDPLELSKLDAGELEERLRGQVLAAYEARKRQLGAGPMLWTIRQILLQTIDLKWKDHLYNMDHLRGVIGFRGYGQKDPKVEYKREGYEMFDTMTRSIEDSVTDYLLKVEFSFGERDVPSVWHADSYIHEAAQVYQQQQEAAAAPQGGEAVGHKPIMSGKEPGRNDPCPCGKTRADGKPVKYKNCCGRRRTA